MLAPQWVKLRIGHFLRRDHPLEAYAQQILLYGLFRKRADDVDGMRRLIALCLGKNLPEPNGYDVPVPGSTETRIYVFQGDASHFDALRNRRQFVYDSLCSITRRKWLSLAKSHIDAPIGICVRLGKDFRPAQRPEDYIYRGLVQTPVSWFVDSLKVIRKELGYNAKALLVSDGTAEQLMPLLSLDNVEFLRPGCAISDLLALAGTSVFIGSGGSSFSAWASFLGNMPTITHPGQSLNWFKVSADPERGYVHEFDPSSPKTLFLQQVIAALDPKSGAERARKVAGA